MSGLHVVFSLSMIRKVVGGQVFLMGICIDRERRQRSCFFLLFLCHSTGQQSPCSCCTQHAFVCSSDDGHAASAAAQRPSPSVATAEEVLMFANIRLQRRRWPRSELDVDRAATMVLHKREHNSTTLAVAGASDMT